MKILYIAHRINESDGSGLHCRAFVKTARELGHEVETYPPIIDIAHDADRWYSPRVFLSWLLRKFSYKKVIFIYEKITKHESELLSLIDGIIMSMKDYIKLRKMLRAYKADVMIYRDSTFQFAPYWIKMSCKVPLVVEQNSLRSVEAKLINKNSTVSCVTYWAEKTAIKSADWIFCVSKEVARQIRQYDSTVNTSIISNGADTDRFSPERYNKPRVKSELGLEGKKIIGYVGSYKTWHGVGTAVKVMEILSKLDGSYHLLLIGSGDEFPHVRKEIEARRLSPFVTQIERLPHEEIPRHIACFDYALMSYPDIKDFHGSPLKLFEYMAMSVPVVVTEIGQMAELIKHGKTGYLVYPPTPHNFADVIISSCSNGTSLEQVGINARNLIKDEYSWMSNVKKVVNICDCAISKYENRL